MNDFELVKEAATIMERHAVISFLEALADTKENYCQDFAAELLRSAATAIRQEEHRHA